MCVADDAVSSAGCGLLDFWDVRFTPYIYMTNTGLASALCCRCGWVDDRLVRVDREHGREDRQDAGEGRRQGGPRDGHPDVGCGDHHYRGMRRHSGDLLLLHSSMLPEAPRQGR